MWLHIQGSNSQLLAILHLFILESNKLCVFFNLLFFRSKLTVLYLLDTLHFQTGSF